MNGVTLVWVALCWRQFDAPSGPVGAHLGGGGHSNLTKKKSYEEAKKLRSLWSKTPGTDFT